MNLEIESTGPKSARVYIRGLERHGVPIQWENDADKAFLIENAKWALHQKFPVQATGRTSGKLRGAASGSTYERR